MGVLYVTKLAADKNSRSCWPPSLAAVVTWWWPLGGAPITLTNWYRSARARYLIYLGCFRNSWGSSSFRFGLVLVPFPFRPSRAVRCTVRILDAPDRASLVIESVQAASLIPELSFLEFSETRFYDATTQVPNRSGKEAAHLPRSSCAPLASLLPRTYVSPLRNDTKYNIY